MIVALAAGSIGDAKLQNDVFGVGTTITAAMAQLAVGTDKVAAGGGRGAGQAYNSLFFLGLLLFLVTFALNFIGDIFVRRVQERY
jgi:phosphate transport system permease protein